MQNLHLDFRCLIIFCYSLFSSQIHAQLGFCQGNSGDPIFTENFGTGTTNTSLPGGTTTYNFIDGYPDDGFYTVVNGSFGNPFDWHEVEDHTPGDSDGKFLIINADFVEGEFFRTSITGLCERTTYEFSAWLLNLLKVDGLCVEQGVEIPINVSFQIWDSTDSNLLASGDTGDIFATAEPNWGEYGLVFQTLESQNSVILKMLNNGQGGCGNDLAIDDIEFKSCGDTVIVTDEANNTSVTICEDETPFPIVLSAIPDFAVFSDHFYQWQESTDGNAWVDIEGETSETLGLQIASAGFYRTKVAEFAENLSNDQCILLSEVFQVTVIQSPDAPVSSGDVGINCETSSAELVVFVDSELTVNWYDSEVDGNLLLSNSSTLVATELGIYYAEVVDEVTGCKSLIRTPVSVLNELQTGNCIIPQGISPDDSPGLNDTFDLSNFAVTEIMIFNRYGTLVYSKNNYTNEWRGQTNDGDDLPVGTYFYTMVYRNGAERKSGWVYVNR